MQLGIFLKTFDRPTLEEALDAVEAHEFECVQFNMESAGLPTVPGQLDHALCEQIREAMADRNIRMAALSGTYNMIHPDPEERRTGMESLRGVAASCGPLGASVVTLCSGTRDPDYMWRHHPDNESPEAWQDLVAAMTEAAQIAGQHNLTFGFEPEMANVVNSAQKARRLLDEVGSPHLKVVLDGANLLPTPDPTRVRESLDEAFDLLGKDIALAHAKDLGPDGFCAAGQGILDYDHYVSLLRSVGYDGALVLHSLDEDQVPTCREFLKEKLEHAG